MVRDGGARGFGSPTLSCHEVCTVGVSSCTRTIWQTSAPAVNFQKGPRARPRWFLHTAYATKNRTHTHIRTPAWWPKTGAWPPSGDGIDGWTQAERNAHLLPCWTQCTRVGWFMFISTYTRRLRAFLLFQDLTSYSLHHQLASRELGKKYIPTNLTAI